MARPQHTAEPKFPRLKNGMGQPSTGTVTAKNVGTGDAVHIASKNSNKKWDGQIDNRVSGDTWNATVKRTRGADKDDEQERGIETVTVTVKNGGGEDSRDTQSDVVP